MNARNFDKLMQQQISEICGNGNGGKKPGLLLLCCIAPCSSASLYGLKEFYELPLLFYNQNPDDNH